jgi:multicomponent Na+:H+ antiporter subunit C
MSLYILSFILFLVGLFGVLTRKNIIKMIFGIAVMEYAVNIFFILIGYKRDILNNLPDYGIKSEILSDPLPESMILTVIIIELAILIVAVSIAVRIYQKYGTFDITKINKLKG